MAGYGAVSPDLPDRITGMAERALELRGRDQLWRRIGEWLRILAALGAVTVVVAAGAWIGGNAGAGVIGTTVVGLATVFLGGKWIEKKTDPPPDSDEDD
jgi:hypothetical protein